MGKAVAFSSFSSWLWSNSISSEAMFWCNCSAGLRRSARRRRRPVGHPFQRHISRGPLDLRGELRRRYREGQEDQLGALGLVVNLVVLWNTI
jgi:hypothetical protein